MGRAINIDVRHVDAAVVVAVSGEIDLATSPSLEAALAAALPDHSRLVVDLQEVTFMDSSGLRSLVSIRQENPTTEIALVIGGGIVQRLIDITGLSDWFQIEDDLESALAPANPQSSSST